DEACPAFLDDFVAAIAHGGVESAGDGHGFAAVLFDAEAGGDEGAASAGGFDDEDAEREAGDDAVAPGEVFGDGRGVHGQFAEDRPTAAVGVSGGDLVEQFAVGVGIGFGEAGAEDGECSSADAEGGVVGGGVDA